MRKNHKHLKLVACLIFAVLVLALSVLSVFAASETTYIYRVSATSDGLHQGAGRPFSVHIPYSVYYTIVQTTDYFYTISTQDAAMTPEVTYSMLTPYVLNPPNNKTIMGAYKMDSSRYFKPTDSVPFYNGNVVQVWWDSSTSVSTTGGSFVKTNYLRVNVDYNGGSTGYSYGNTSQDYFMVNRGYFDFYLPRDYDLQLVPPNGKEFRGWVISTDNYTQIWDTDSEFATPVLSRVDTNSGSFTNPAQTITIRAVWRDIATDPEEPPVDPPVDPGGDPSEFVSVVRIIDGQFLDRYTFASGNTIEVCTTPVTIRYYNFGGWFYDLEYTEPVSSDDVVTSDTYIYGKMDYVGPADVDLTELVDTVWSNFYNTFVDLTSNLVIGGVSVITILTVLLLIVLVYLIVKIIKG